MPEQKHSHIEVLVSQIIAMRKAGRTKQKIANYFGLKNRADIIGDRQSRTQTRQYGEDASPGKGDPAAPNALRHYIQLQTNV